MAENEYQMGDLQYRLTEEAAILTGFNKERTTLELPNLVNGIPVCDIEPAALDGCNALRDISLPMRMDMLPLPELKDCPNLEAIRVSPLNEEFSSADGILYNKDQTVLLDCPVGRKKDVKMPESVVRIAKGAFSGCKEIQKLTFSPNLEAIEADAFGDCIRLHEMILPMGLQHIGKNAFFHCKQLRKISIPADIDEAPDLSSCSSLDEIRVSPANESFCAKDGVLYDKYCNTLLHCPKAKSGQLHIPLNVSNIAEGALSDCGRITGIYVPPKNMTFRDIDGVLYSKDGTKLLYCPAGRTAPLFINEEVTKIRPGAFSLHTVSILLIEDGKARDYWMQSSDLAAIEVSKDNPVFSSENGVLYNKDKTTLLRCPAGYSRALTIPDSVTKIADCAFAGCNVLPELTLNENLTEIGVGALMGCFRLNRMRFPKSLQTVGENAFSGCVHLHTVYMPGTLNVPDEMFSDCEDVVILRY